MRIVRGLGGMVLWLVASVVCLVAIILCVTVVLLPVGVALFKVGRRLFGSSMKLMLPRVVTHPIDELSSGTKKRFKKGKKGLRHSAKALPL